MPIIVLGYSVTSVVRETRDEVLVRARRDHDGLEVLARTQSGGRLDARAAARYRFAHSLAERLASAAVSPIIDLIDGSAHAALVYPAGKLLVEQLAPEGVALDEFFAIARAVATALDTIHQAGWIHGDVRGSSVRLDASKQNAVFLDLQWATPRDAGGSSGGAADGMLPYVAPERTGRVGRHADHRADIYSLGALLYELLSGHPPFVADDPLKLVHAHVALVAPSVCDLRPDVPRAVGDIVGKTLAKSPDDRYQTCRGLLADLARAREISTRATATFELGREDAAAMLALPRKLYGRDGERATLVECFSRSAAGHAEVLVVAGQPGVGKSSLIAELEPHVAGAGGFFLSGKFDQLLLNAPYSALKKSFDELMQRLLSESEDSIRQWRARLRDAVGTQGRLITDLVPSLERLIGPQPAVETVGPIEAQHRLVTVFRRFVHELARPEHPLVLFLDDWHWADAASAAVVEELVTAPEPAALMLVLAYRDNELAPTGRASIAIERLRDNGVPITAIALPPLPRTEIEALVREAFRCHREHAAQLAAHIDSRTRGNPLFVRSFLQSLHDAGRLKRNAAGEWSCDLDALARDTGDASVIDLLVARVGRLPANTRDLLEIAACLGNEFRTRDLAVAACLAESDITGMLTAAIEAALVTAGFASYRFVHDRVQEAVYMSIEADRRAHLHVTIGRRLHGHSPGEPTTHAVEQLNAGRVLITDPAERAALAALNAQAGQRARGATAYASAARHAAVGIELVGNDGWARLYDLTLGLYALRAESEYLSGQFAIAEELYDIALAHARSDLDRIRILGTKKDQLELQGRYIDAIAVLREGLALVGILLPDSDDELRAVLADELAQVAKNLAGRRIDRLVDAPDITDPRLIATLQLLMGLWPSCYVAGLQRLLTVVSLKIANFCLVHGNSEVTSAAYVNYSFVAGYVTGDYETAYEFGKLGITLSDRYPNRAIRAWCYFLFGCGTAVWRRPLVECTPYLERAFELGVESGSVASACYAASYIVTDSFFRGKPLAEVTSMCRRYEQFLQANSPAIRMYLDLGIRSMWRLVGNDSFDDTGFLAAFRQSPFFMATHAFGQLAAAYHLDDTERAVECADAAVRVVPDLLAGIFKVAETAMYAALAWLAAAERANGAERAQLRARAEQQLVVLQQLASHCEENCSHKVLLVEAELARVERRVDESIALFDRAIDAAARAGFQQYTALGCELAARAWRARGFPRAARAYMQDAYHAYAAWGASAKLRVLEARYPELLRAPHGPGRGDADALIGGPTASSEPVDMLSVARATQAISREIDPDSLLTRLMSVFIENAGARRGALVKVDGDEMQVVAAAEGFEVRLGSATTPLPASSHVVESIVRYVVRTGESVRLDDASREGRFTRDPQVRQRGSRSIVCLPLRMQDRAIGAVFLENELGAAAFTRTREIVLDLLARQAAISLENSRLYADLMAANRKLEEARVAAEAANRTKDEFLAMLGHELRNPLAPVLTACQLMAMVNREQFAREREVIERQVTHMIRLVDDLLDVSRIARGQIELLRKHLDLREVVDSAIELVTPLLEDSGSRIALSATDQPLPTYADPTRLAQVLSNVLTNAIKFSPKCAVVEVSIEDSGSDAIVRVVDHGAGIAAELLPAIFDLFVQAQQPRDRRLGGLGLGLSIAKNLAELHGGAIAAHSDGPGQGSEFRIVLPLERRSGTAPTAARNERRALPTKTPRRILIVDDNVDAALLLVDAVTAIGHTSEVAHDGPTALQFLSEFKPEIVLLDVGLPLMDGFEVARRIRNEHGTTTPRLIAITGYSAVSGSKRSVFDEYLVKPVSIDALMSIIEATGGGE